MEDKSFMKDAEGFLGAWKNDYAEKNKDILDRAQKRRADADKMHDEFLKDLKAFGEGLEGTAKSILEHLEVNFEAFSKALKEGTATISDKLELEKGFEQLSTFMERAEKKGAAQFKIISASLSKKLSEFNTELKSERVGDDKVLEGKDQAKEIGSGIDKLHDNVKKMFDDFL